MRKALLALITMAFGVVAFLLIAEFALQLMPVNAGLRAQTVTAAQPIFHFQPNRESTFAKGWDFQMINRVKVNNAGFVNDRDYDPAATSPLLAVIGDSYVEALMVPFQETIAGRLQERAGARGRVYSFAASGAGLGQYLAWARHARDTYRPDGFVFVNIGNDFSEALWERERNPGFHGMKPLPEGGFELNLMPYEPSPLRLALRQSALAMYLFTQVEIQSLFRHGPIVLGENDRRWVGNVAATVPAEFLAQSKWVAEAFLDALPRYAGVEPAKIVIVIDGIRPDMYEPSRLPAAEDSYWGRMRRHMAEAARARGYTVIDMHPPFLVEFARSGRRFEFPIDSHWNGLAHGLAAQAVAETRLFQSLFGAK